MATEQEKPEAKKKPELENEEGEANDSFVTSHGIKRGKLPDA